MRQLCSDRNMISYSFEPNDFLSYLEDLNKTIKHTEPQKELNDKFWKNSSFKLVRECIFSQLRISQFQKPI